MPSNTFDVLATSLSSREIASRRFDSAKILLDGCLVIKCSAAYPEHDRAAGSSRCDP